MKYLGKISIIFSKTKKHAPARPKPKEKHAPARPFLVLLKREL